MKKRLILFLAIAVAVAALVIGAAVTLAADTVPTVVFDAGAKEFSFLNCDINHYADGDFPDLFPDIKNAMPGDSFKQTVRVRVINAGENVIKMYLRSENPNEDYARLLSVGEHPATLSTRFAMEATTAPFVSGLLRRDTAAGATLTYREPISESAFLGTYHGPITQRDIEVSFEIPVQAGNELKGLTAMVDWVFLAELIPITPEPTEPPTPPEPPTPTEPPEPTESPEPTEPPTEPINPYKPSSDVAVWNVDLMEYHVAYIIGSDDGLVHPEALVTRAEIATIFFRLMTTECRERYWNETNTFNDVPSDAWYNTAISTLANAGIINGYEDGSYRPNQPITRAEFVTIVSRIVSARNPARNPYSDTAGHWAEPGIDSAYTIGLLEGYPDGTFQPDITISRAEVITITNRVLGRTPDIRYLLDNMIEWPDNMDAEAWYYLEIQEATNTHLHGYSWKDYGDREYWVQLEMNIDWKTVESPDYTGTHEIYSSSIDNEYRD